jgi:hypothetical protein
MIGDAGQRGAQVELWAVRDLLYPKQNGTRPTQAKAQPQKEDFCQGNEGGILKWV